MVLAARAAAGSVVGLLGSRAYQPRCPASKPGGPPTDVGGGCPGPLAPFGGGARAEWRCVCPEREGDAWPGLRRPLQPQGLLCMQKELERQLELRKSRVGGGWLLQALEPAQTQSRHSKPREARARWPEARALPCTLTPHPSHSPLTCLHLQHAFPCVSTHSCSYAGPPRAPLQAAAPQGHPPRTPFPPFPSLPNRAPQDDSSNRHACARQGHRAKGREHRPEARSPGFAASCPCDHGQVASPRCAHLLRWVRGAGLP